MFTDFLQQRAIKTEVVVVTETVAQAVVYVDENGVPYLTSRVDRVSSVASATVEATRDVSTSITPTQVQPVPTLSTGSSMTSAPLVNPAPSSSTVVPAPSIMSVASPSIVSQPSTSSSSATALQPMPSKAPEYEPSSAVPAPIPSTYAAQPPPDTVTYPTKSNDDNFPLGITYDPFKGVPGQCQCKTASEMGTEFDKMKDFGIIRIYGNDCGVIPVAVQQVKKNGQKLMAGIYTPNQDINTVVDALSDAVDRYNGGNWGIIELVSVENERVNAHVMTASDAHESVTQARRALNSAGYFGPIGVVETAPAIIDNPSLCEKSDMALVNIHAFFDSHTKAEDAGDFVKSEVARVKKACPNKRVVVTESGWPSQGTSHDEAVVSKDAQRAAISSIRAVFDHDLFLFNAFDSPWKTDDDSTWNSERYWGIL
jgi:exo-beta-1,3-glucanase (GH17 family)